MIVHCLWSVIEVASVSRTQIYIRIVCAGGCVRVHVWTVWPRNVSFPGLFGSINHSFGYRCGTSTEPSLRVRIFLYPRCDGRSSPLNTGLLGHNLEGNCSPQSTRGRLRSCNSVHPMPTIDPTHPRCHRPTCIPVNICGG